MLRGEARQVEVVITVTVLEILLETGDWRSHVFPVDFAGHTRSAECGDEFSVGQLTATYDIVPTCGSCRDRWGTYQADKLEMFTQGAPARMRALLESLPEGTWTS
ncbi:hypothetical protein SAMN04488074_11934 [Lentzea albidocapillata subsp. violacea]|uniref:Uncharacterized protein n=1 Tax=Lentzea albidocapillata subsp. violacea TaxID=128104 RepID=A0A1G9RVM7_9PSEU|nr:hypothetical protein [Lentzea albidocapillata]SDM27273.1 hypothetical protein SAMN04488074_11934 [Lentzea albidocapillata subsp. violacea]